MTEEVELAEERTQWSIERTALANERTFAAWLRTGLAATAAGIVLAKLAADFEPKSYPVLLGISLCVIAAMLHCVGLVTYLRTASLVGHIRLRAIRIASATVGVLLVISAVASALLLYLGSVHE